MTRRLESCFSSRNAQKSTVNNKIPQALILARSSSTSTNKYSMSIESEADTTIDLDGARSYNSFAAFRSTTSNQNSEKPRQKETDTANPACLYQSRSTGNSIDIDGLRSYNSFAAFRRTALNRNPESEHVSRQEEIPTKRSLDFKIVDDNKGNPKAKHTHNISGRNSHILGFRVSV